MKGIISLLLLAMSMFGSVCAQAETMLTEGTDQMEEITMSGYDFSVFPNVTIHGTDLSALSEEEISALYQATRYCQAMTDADIETMREIVAEDTQFVHMTGMRQTREEYFADVADGSLTYYTIGMENPVVTINRDYAQVTYTSILNANAYGARGTYRMSGTHWFQKQDGIWIAINSPNN